MGDDMKKEWLTIKLEKSIEKVKYPAKILKKDFNDDGIYPIISQEKEYINGYWDVEEDLFKTNKPVIIFGDHTKVLKYVDFDFVLGADGVKILQPKDFINPRYFYYFLHSINLIDLGYARHYRLLKEIDIV